MDIGFLRMMPNLVLVAPSNELEMKQALVFALSHPGPVVLRYPRDMVPEMAFVPKASKQRFELGKAVWMNDKTEAEIVIVCYGSTLTEALQAEALLADDGIDVGILNARFAAPVDETILSLLVGGQRLLTLEDHRVACGFGSALLERAAQEDREILGQVRVLGAPRSFVAHNGRAQQLMKAGLNADEIANTVKAWHETLLYKA